MTGSSENVVTDKDLSCPLTKTPEQPVHKQNIGKQRDAVCLCHRSAPRKNVQLFCHTCPLTKRLYSTYDQLSRFLTGFGYEEKEDSLDTNGWDNDYWVTFSSDEIDLDISGTMATGEFRITI